MTKSMLDGFTNGVVTSLERRFQLRSRDIGTLFSMYEITIIVTVLPLSYFGGRGHKPIWISSGYVIMGVASLLFALPHFTTDRYAYFSAAKSENATCALIQNASLSTRSALTMLTANMTSSVDSCGDESGQTVSSLTRYIYVFGASKVILGFGSSCVGVLALVLLDESITAKQSGPYISM